MRKKIGSALVVGGGISGIRSALDLAELGYQVKLIDRAPNLGGTLMQLDYQFPSDHCGMCKMLPLVERDSSSQYCLRKGLFHENIEIMLSTELVGMEGEPGKYQVTLRQKPTMVDPELCIGCDECARVCPVEVPDEFNAGLSKRKAVYLPVPHNIPNHYVVDMESCTMCGECEKICPTGAIDFRWEARRQFRILVVDDELIVRESLRDWLTEDGFEVEMAESGPEALEKMARQVYNLMLLDIKMPGMDGVEVLKRSKELRPELPVVMMTAYATVETAVEAMKIGALDYLMKPFDPETLAPLVVKLYENLVRADERELEVGAVVLAAGFGSFDPVAAPINTYGYGEVANVVTSIEYERMISGTGPNEGKFVRPSDGKEIQKVAWLQCVGSRDIQSDADYCSSVCCMFSIKEALLAKERSNGKVDTTIFYMDMRTFGKNFQRYKDRAENEYGVRFQRSRVHSVEQMGLGGDPKITYTDISGAEHEEVLDLVVLAAGQRPPAGAEALAEMTGVELNPWGFCQLQPFSLSLTEQEGVLVSGSFSGLRDISESVIQASSASLRASSLIHAKGGGLAEATEPQPVFRDVSRELPEIMVALCSCGDNLTQAAKLEEVEEAVADLDSVSQVQRIERICTQEGWNQLEEALRDSKANRLLIGACMPYVYGRKLRELGKNTGLSSALMEVVDISTPALPGRNSDPEQVGRDVWAAVGMGVGKLKGMDPSNLPSTPIIQKALVVGGGIGGMSSALAIAEHGFEVFLVEKAEELGGNLRALHRTLEGDSPQELLEQTVSRVEKHPNIQVYTKSQVLHSRGRVGQFRTTIEKEDGMGESLEHGVTVLATGGKEASTESYGYGQSESIVTQHQLEEKLHSGAVNPGELGVVTMIQCVDSREEPRNYCSRVCCSSALKNGLYLKEQNPEIEVYVLYRDIMAYGFLETYYTKARQAGVIFIQYEVSDKPRVDVDNGRIAVGVTDPILGREVVIESDLLVLSTGIVPNDQGKIAEIFEVETDQDGFFQEAEYKWRPVDFIKEGVFTCGIAHSPRSVTETIAMSEAAAQRALRILSSESVMAGSTVAEVHYSLCSLCEMCIAACPYGARWRDEDEEKILVDELACQGCGSCAAVCPNSASVLR
ncbi:MAG: FAD-dependent oxidoreductase, partial [Desulfovibrionaceae bacterium]|nr:FAD-dependent oxidoreductase [Desulfovibrionaceae bacterium]